MQMTKMIQSRFVEAFHEFTLRASHKDSVRSTQRMYGVALGLRIALLQIAKIEGIHPSKVIPMNEEFDTLMRDWTSKNDGHMTADAMMKYVDDNALVHKTGAKQLEMQEAAWAT